MMTYATIVCNHYKEATHWMLPLLKACEWVSLVLYDCGVDPLPAGIAEHERVAVAHPAGRGGRKGCWAGPQGQ